MTDPTIVTLVALIAGLLIGAVGAWLLLRDRHHPADYARIVSAESRAAAAEARASAGDAGVARLSDAFRALAADALDKNAQGFLQLAEEKFRTLREQAAGDFGQRADAVAALLRPLGDTLAAYQREARELAETSAHRIGSVDQQLQHVVASTSQLSQETSRLVNALRQPHVRGRWGEIALRRTAELAGMVAYCDFVEQETLFTETGRLRPDMIVNLPSGRRIVVDSKVPLTAYLEALDPATDEHRRNALKRHVQQIRQHVQRLSSKDYADAAGSLEFVVLFIPNDTFLAAAAEEDPDIIEWALGQHVVIATPTTFIALLRAVAFGWRQEKVAENAERVSTLGRELSDRLFTFADHLSTMGKALARSVEAYNRAVGSLESRVLVTARKFAELGAGGQDPIAVVEPVEAAVRALSPSELELEPPSVLDPPTDTDEERMDTDGPSIDGQR
jgi:DNA recombination protein RmuC